jgi:2-methylisocitrate lyase-like PEP mutase family enzyme
VNVDHLSQVVDTIPRPVNVLLVPSGPTVDEMSEIGVRRLSTGGALAFVAYGAVARAARELLAEGTQTYSAGALTGEERKKAFD